MKTFASIGIVLLLALGPSGAAFARPLAFCAPSSAIDEARVRDYFATRQLVVVHGYWGGEFDDNREAVHAIDACIPVTTINPLASASVEENAEALIPRLRKAASENLGNEIVLLGHSKGGAEILQLAIEHPEIFSDGKPLGFKVAITVTVQAAIGGSVLADLELQRDEKLAARWSAFAEKNGGAGDSFIARTLKNLFLGSGSAGFRALATRESAERNAYLRRKFAVHPAATRALLNEKIAYVTAMRNPENTGDLPFYLDHLGRFLAEGGEPNDGLVELWHQTLPGIGRELFNVRGAGHFSLVADKESAACRREFTRLLLSEIAAPVSSGAIVP